MTPQRRMGPMTPLTPPGARCRPRLAALLAAALLAVLVCAQAAVLAIGRKDAVAQMEASAKGVAVSVAHTLELDPEGYREFARTKDTGSPYYKKMHHLLEEIQHDTDGIKYIDTETRLDEGTTEFVLDSEPEDSKDHHNPGETNRSDPLKDRVFTSGATVTYGGSARTVSRRGDLIEAYAPIHGEGGEILGAVGVDIEGGHLLHQFGRTVATLAAADLALALLFAVVVLYFSDALLGYLFRGVVRVWRRDWDPQGADYRRGVALMVIELDGLRHIYGSHGRRFGARILAAASEIIRASIRPSDRLVRLGRKGFAVVLADPAPGNAVDVAERIRAGVEGAPMFDRDSGSHVRMTVSIGVAIGDGRARSADELAESAERALAMAKSGVAPVVVLGAGGGLTA